MKKLTLLTVLLLALGLSMGFGQELKTSATLSGSATATWGIDLKTMDTGFTNSAAAALTLNLIPADQSFTKAGEGAVYGSITISNVELYWSDAVLEVFGPADTDVAAKIVAGDLSVAIYTFPTFSYAYAGYVPLWAASAGYATTCSVTPRQRARAESRSAIRSGPSARSRSRSPRIRAGPPLRRMHTSSAGISPSLP